MQSIALSTGSVEFKLEILHYNDSTDCLFVGMKVNEQG